MKHIHWNHSAAILIAFGLFLSLAQSAHADKYVIPPQLHHEGLSFSPATTFDKPINLPANTANVEFVPPKPLKINDHQQHTKDLTKIVVTPTPGNNPQIVDAQAQTIMPTPTIYIAPAKPATVTPEEPTPTPKTTAKLFTPTPTTINLTPTLPPVTITVAANVGGLNADKLFNMANAYRQTKGLPAFEKEDRTCSLAASRAPEINAEVAAGTMHSGLRARNLPYWNTENIISMNSEEAAFNWWINDTIHREAIESSNKYSCVACSGNACAEEFTSFQPK